MVSDPILASDHAQAFLVPHLRQTETLFRLAITEFDNAGSCEIVPAADLCFPHDVIRIAGGFATGCLVQWQSSLPLIPVDTTVNIDTTSLFWLSDDISSVIDEARLENLKGRIEAESTYLWNFHKGNHFIAFVRSCATGRPALLIHSNEKEFKYQFNGLMPVPGNWFMDDVKVFRSATGGYIRLLLGRKAELFYQLAMMLEPYNVNRHRFVATALLSSLCHIESEYHKHHYYMPTNCAVAIGCYLCDPGEVVPILSRPGYPIHMFQVHAGGSNQVRLTDGRQSLLVPHGWGKTSIDPVTVSYDEDHFTVNGMTFENRPLASLGKHPGLVLRDFSDNPHANNSLFAQMAHHTPGEVIDSLHQQSSYCQGKFRRHDSIEATSPPI